MKHPQHNRLTKEVKSWFHQTTTENTQESSKSRYTLYTQDQGNTLVENLIPEDINAFLKDLADHSNGRPAKFFIDNRQSEAKLKTQLIQAGCERLNEWTYLAHVKNDLDLTPIPVPSLSIEEVTESNVLDYQITKLKGFGNTEKDPDPSDIESGLALRKTEMAGDGRFLIGRIEGEAAAVISWFEGHDRLLLHLATRIPFRKHGIAKHLLSHVITDTYAKGCQSITLFTNPKDTPIELYKRLGFTDEVYWRASYQFDPKNQKEKSA